MKKLILCLFVLLLPFKVVASAEIKPVDNGLASNAKSAILIEGTTGKILFEKNSHEKLAPASMTKIISMLIIIEAIEKGIIKWEQKITVSENASSMGGSQILLEANEEISIADLFKGVAVASGNDAVVALAEATYGTVDEFVKEMNKKAKELNLKDTNFKNPHGLDEANHYSSAYDMSIIAKELIKHEKVLEYTSIYEDYLRKGTDKEFWLVNTNKLVRFYKGADGLKTGYTSSAGYCLTATALKDNARLIAVVMNEPSSNTRNAEVTTLLDYGFTKIKVYPLLKKDTIIKKVEVAKSDTKEALIVPVEDISIVKAKQDSLGKITYKLNLNDLKAPIKKGDQIGTLIIKENDKKIREVKVTVKSNIKVSSFIKLYFKNLKDLIQGNIIF